MATITCEVSGVLLDEGLRTGPVRIQPTRETGQSGDTVWWCGEPAGGIPGSTRPRPAVLELDDRDPVSIEIEGFHRFRGLGRWPLD